MTIIDIAHTHRYFKLKKQKSQKSKIMRWKGILFCSHIVGLKLFVYFSVSEVPKETPIARKYDSRHELEEVKSTEQMKEEVSALPSIYIYHLTTSGSIF